MPTVVLAPDKFKGSLTAAQVATHVATGLRRVVPDVSTVVVPVADGGDGTLAAAEAAGFIRVEVTASGPDGSAVASAYGRRGAEAVVELAEVSGLAQLPEGHFLPRDATSRGTGELVRAALDAGARRIVVGVGGSACTDGGAGLLTALGARVLDSRGRPVAPGGAGIADVTRLVLDGLHPALPGADLVVATDVDNPLTGPKGAAAVYGPQKGATEQDVADLDAALSRWADVVADATGVDLRDEPGAGAAGGVGFALLAVLRAQARPGASVVFELTGLHDVLVGADLVVTGEGALDTQTLHGKAPAAVAAAARDAGIPVVAVAGVVQLERAALTGAGFAGAYALVDVEDEPGQSFSDPGPLLERLGEQVARDHLGGAS